MILSFLSSLPLKEKKKKGRKKKKRNKKESTSSPGGAADRSGGEDWKEESEARRGEAHTALGGQGRAVQRGEGSGQWLLLSSAIPAHCPGDFNTTKGTGVCRVISDREERGAGETSRENLADPPKTCLPPFLPVGKQ